MDRRHALLFGLGFLAAAVVFGVHLYRKYRIAPEIDPSTLTLTELDGTPVAWSSLGDGPVLVNFWQTWCGPCLAEMPDLDLARFELEPGGFEVVVVSDEDPARIESFRQRTSYGFRYLRVPSLADIGVHAYPTTILFRKDGSVAFKVVGMERWTSEKTLRKLRRVAEVEAG